MKRACWLCNHPLLLCRGRDFRTAFTRIGGLRALTDAPFMALTALAPPNIESAIVETLQLKNAAVVSRQLDRSNIAACRCKSLNVSSVLLAMC